MKVKICTVHTGQLKDPQEMAELCCILFAWANSEGLSGKKVTSLEFFCPESDDPCNQLCSVICDVQCSKEPV